MNAQQKIREALKEAYDDSRVNAMEVFKGYAADTGMTGWHFRDFGRSESVFLGTSVYEAKETVQEIIDTREIVPYAFS